MCGGALADSIVHFGEKLDAEELERARGEAKVAHLALGLGSTWKVGGWAGMGGLGRVGGWGPGTECMIACWNEVGVIRTDPCGEECKLWL